MSNLKHYFTVKQNSQTAKNFNLEDFKNVYCVFIHIRLRFWILLLNNGNFYTMICTEEIEGSFEECEEFLKKSYVDELNLSKV